MASTMWWSLALSFVVFAIGSWALDTTCPISDVTIATTQEAAGSEMTWETVRERLLSTPWDDPKTTALSCIDGRETSSVFAAPGGDAGEFLASLAAYNEYATAAGVTVDTVDLFHEFASALDRPFYYHTDSHAMAMILTILNVDKATFQALPAAQRATALNYLVQPNYIGCGHIRLLITKPDNYSVPLKLTQDFITAFFTNYWQDNEMGRRTELRLTSHKELAGEHEELAVVTVKSDVSKDSSSVCGKLSAKASPLDRYGATFVYHPDAALLFRRRVCKFLSRHAPYPDYDALLSRATQLAAKHLDLTVTALAPNLPRYTAQVILDTRVMEDRKGAVVALSVCLGIICLITLGLILHAYWTRRDVEVAITQAAIAAAARKNTSGGYSDSPAQPLNGPSFVEPADLPPANGPAFRDPDDFKHTQP